MKYLLTFSKGDTVRWLGHLDMLRTFERAIRRAELPVAFSSGFNPRERLSFASALSVGTTGEAELVTLELTESVATNEIVDRLNDKLPPGIRIVTTEAIPEAGSRDLLNSFDRAEMRVLCDCPPGITLASVQQSADVLLALPSLTIERQREGRTKRIDIRPFIHALDAISIDGERVTLKMVLAVGQEGSVRPAEIVAILAETVPGLAVRRTHRIRMIASGCE